MHLDDLALIAAVIVGWFLLQRLLARTGISS